MTPFLLQVPPLVDFQQQFDELVTKLVGPLTKLLNDWSNQVATNAAQGLDDLIQPVVGWFTVDTANFVLHTPLALVNTLSSYIGLADWEPLLQSAAGTAFLVGAIAYAGHYWWGWPGIDDSLQRIGVTVVVVGASDRLLDASLSLVDSLVNALAKAMPPLPVLTGLHPVLLVILVAFWLFLLGRLVLVMGKRIAWLAVLKALAPLALMTMIHHKSAWIAGTFARLWIGWLIGQIIVVMVLILAVAIASEGFVGYILSCACLMVAHDAVYIFAPKDGGLSISVGRVRIGG